MSFLSRERRNYWNGNCEREKHLGRSVSEDIVSRVMRHDLSINYAFGNVFASL